MLPDLHLCLPEWAFRAVLDAHADPRLDCVDRDLAVHALRGRRFRRTFGALVWRAGARWDGHWHPRPNLSLSARIQSSRAAADQVGAVWLHRDGSYLCSYHPSAACTTVYTRTEPCESTVSQLRCNLGHYRLLPVAAVHRHQHSALSAVGY